MTLTGEIEVLGGNPVPLLLCPPQISHRLTCDRIRLQRLTAWAIALLISSEILEEVLFPNFFGLPLSLSFYHCTIFTQLSTPPCYVRPSGADIALVHPRTAPWPLLGAGLPQTAPPFHPGYLWRFLDRNVHCVRLSVSRPNPKQRTTVSPFGRVITFELSDMREPTSSYATAGRALRIIWPLKPHHYVKVQISLWSRISTSSVWLLHIWPLLAGQRVKNLNVPIGCLSRLKKK